MKCIKCKTNNINKANYCKNCAYKFSEKEQKIAKRKTFIGKIEMIEDFYNVCSLKVVTDHILFKIATIILVLGIGIYFWITNGTNLNLLESDNYKIQYNEKKSEYYLIGKEEEIPLDLYVPEKSKEIIVKHYDKDNNIINEDKYSKTDNITLEINSNKDYYVIESIYENNNLDQIKLYVYLEEYVEV